MPPLGEGKMWVTNYMDNYNKVKKQPKKFQFSSRHSTPSRRNTPQATTYSVRPKTASSRAKTPTVNNEPPRPQTPTVCFDLPPRPPTPYSNRPKTATPTFSPVPATQTEAQPANTEKTQQFLSFKEFSKQFNNLKVKFDSYGYVIPQKYFPPEKDLTVQGQHMALSERDGENQNQTQTVHTVSEILENIPQTDIVQDNEENKDENEQKETTDEVPEVADKPKDYHWICWPEAQATEEPPQRPHTSLGIHRAPTPYGGGPGDDIEDRPCSVIPGYGFGDSEDITRGPPMTYVPELKSWINSSNEYDKDVAQNIMTTMYSSLAPPLPPEALRPKRQMTFSYGGRRSNNSNYNSMPDPLTHYSQSWRPLYEDRRTISRQNEMRHSVPSFPQIPGLERSKTDLYSSPRRPIRYPRTEDYIHERSMFMTTQPSCTGHFIIHPDWVSERSGKIKLTAGRKNGSSRNGLRYGTPHEI